VFARPGLVILFARPRLLRLASAEAELATRRKYEAALRESEQRLQVITIRARAGRLCRRERRYASTTGAYEEWFGRATWMGAPARGLGRGALRDAEADMERALRGERVT